MNPERENNGHLRVLWGHLDTWQVWCGLKMQTWLHESTNSI